MARTALTINTVTTAGVTTTGNLTAGTADGKYITNEDENVCLLVVNTDAGAARDITVTTPATVGSGALTIEDEVFSIGISSTGIIGPWENRYFQQSDGFVHIDFHTGEESDIEVYAFKVPKNL